ncbi:hypothetical protein K458DRAFT_476178 [Lentithecium fluviatile CBS 122367]|uniref:Stress-response A/B barrel domain-containing protein n=1 Tax=Lentithecium fluviatile CBS 122367 TaxID=1168545 RepID=A0A6G1JAN3_9PLEO|nr:hypothetical protein K458DRAFT_476178 [Lentithecium fluviatile CBS 122367]
MPDQRIAPVTRIACFKFYPTVTPAQKGDRTRAFLNLYAQHENLILEMPRGGKPLNTPLKLTNVEREKDWDTGFVVRFKSDEARREFDREPGHERLKEETDPLLQRVFVYDFVEEEGLGW